MLQNDSTASLMTESLQIDKPNKLANPRRASLSSVVSLRESQTEPTDLNGLLDSLERHETGRLSRNGSLRSSARRKHSAQQQHSPIEETDDADSPPYRSWRQKIAEEIPDYDKYSTPKRPPPSLLDDQTSSGQGSEPEITRLQEVDSENVSEELTITDVTTVWDQRRSIRDSGIDEILQASDGAGSPSPRPEPKQQRREAEGGDEGFETDSQTNRFSPAEDKSSNEEPALATPPVMRRSLPVEKVAKKTSTTPNYLRDTKSSSPMRTVRTTNASRAGSAPVRSVPNTVQINSVDRTKKTTNTVSSASSPARRPRQAFIATTPQRRPVAPKSRVPPDEKSGDETATATQSEHKPKTRQPELPKITTPLRVKSGVTTRSSAGGTPGAKSSLSTANTIPNRRVPMNKPVPDFYSPKTSTATDSAKSISAARKMSSLNVSATAKKNSASTVMRKTNDKRLERLLSPPKPRAVRVSPVTKTAPSNSISPKKQTTPRPVWR